MWHKYNQLISKSRSQTVLWFVFFLMHKEGISLYIMLRNPFYFHNIFLQGKVISSPVHRVFQMWLDKIAVRLLIIYHTEEEKNLIRWVVAPTLVLLTVFIFVYITLYFTVSCGWLCLLGLCKTLFGSRLWYSVKICH